MTKKQIIKMLEKRFVEAHNAMDKAIELNNREETRYYASISCEIAEILAEINNKSVDGEIARLYMKFNLLKGE